jgi:hypothetical protein
MKKTNVVWLALVAVILYIAVSYTSNAQAQQGPVTVRLNGIGVRQSDSVQVSGRIIGFSCVNLELTGPRCFVATTD